jgi:hypothetical protein
LSEHAAGPWEVLRGAHSMGPDEYSVWPVGAAGDGEKRIACWMRSEADARLVAAAPDLLAAARAILGDVARYRERGGTLTEREEANVRALADAVALAGKEYRP